MITVSIDDRAVSLRLQNMPKTLQSRLEIVTASLAEKLRTHIVRDKLLGQVLKRITGRLGRSIQWRLDQTGQKVEGVVYSAGDVPYAAIHEYGGRTAAHVIEPKNGKALRFMMNGKEVFARRVNHPGSTMPERSYMRSSLSDMREEIVSKLKQAVQESVQI